MSSMWSNTCCVTVSEHCTTCEPYGTHVLSATAPFSSRILPNLQPSFIYKNKMGDSVVPLIYKCAELQKKRAWSDG